jgi:hypothetical protein
LQSVEKLKLAKDIFLVDICGKDGFQKLKEAFTGADTVIIATSAVPQLIWWSLPMVRCLSTMKLASSLFVRFILLFCPSPAHCRFGFINFFGSTTNGG